MSLEKPWSANSNAPQIPYVLYIEEKTNFAGNLIAAIFYGMLPHASLRPRSPSSVLYMILGIVVILFFQCMDALLNPADRTRGTRWLLVAHTVTMFLFTTISTAMGMVLQSTSDVDNREFPGNDRLPPGPFGYNFLLFTNAITIIPNVLFLLNNWLADGLLVSPALNLVAWLFNVGHPSSSIVAGLSMP